jgi:hypothetical protein
MKKVYALMFALGMAGFPACKQKNVEQATPAPQESVPAAPMPEESEEMNPAEMEGVEPEAPEAPAAPAAPQQKK